MIMREALQRMLYMKKAEVKSRNHELDIADIMEAVEHWYREYVE